MAHLVTSKSFQPDGSLFRANDIRGLAMGDDANLTPEFAFHLGKAFGSLLVENNLTHVWLCRDARLSSPELHERIVLGLTETGATALDIGVGPTPLLCHAATTAPAPYQDCHSGIMITASHNPFDHNGFKLIFNNKPFFGEDLSRLEQRIVEENYQQGVGKHLEVDHAATYLSDIQARVPNLAREGLVPKVVLDTANGSAGPLAVEALTKIGVNIIPLYCEMDGTFPNHSPDTSNPENLADLVAKVRETNAYCGIALDGDGDRMVAVTETGNILNADCLLSLFSTDVLSANPNATIVFDVKTSNKLIHNIRSEGGRPFMTKSGRSHIQSTMQAENASLAGEFSCHFFFADKWHGSDDGIYAAARLLEICQKLKKPLSVLCKNASSAYSTDEIGIPVSDKRKFQLISDFVRQSKFEGANLVTTDGLRIEYPAGWALVRASNTSAKLTLRFEADSQPELSRLVSLVRQELLKIEPTLDLHSLNPGEVPALEGN